MPTKAELEELVEELEVKCSRLSKTNTRLTKQISIYKEKKSLLELENIELAAENERLQDILVGMDSEMRNMDIQHQSDVDSILDGVQKEIKKLHTKIDKFVKKDDAF